MRLFILVLCLTILPIILFFSGSSLPVLWVALGVSSIGVAWFLLRRIPRLSSETLTGNVEKKPLKVDVEKAENIPNDIPQPVTEKTIAERPTINVERKFLIADMEESESSYKAREAD